MVFASIGNCAALLRLAWFDVIALSPENEPKATWAKISMLTDNVYAAENYLLGQVTPELPMSEVLRIHTELKFVDKIKKRIEGVVKALDALKERSL